MSQQPLLLSNQCSVIRFHPCTKSDYGLQLTDSFYDIHSDQIKKKGTSVIHKYPPSTAMDIQTSPTHARILNYLL